MWRIFDAFALPGLIFVGVTSAIPFDHLQIRESKTYPTGGIQYSTPSGGLADREFFGAFHVFAVPEPSSAALVALGGILLMLLRRRKGEPDIAT